MVSLKKIRNLIKQYKNRNFRNEVTKEKSQKYLFRDEKITTREKTWNIFRKNGERISPFMRFLQEKVYISPKISQNQQAYLKYIGIFLISASLYIILYSPYFLISPSKVLIEWLDEWIDISVAYRSIEDMYGQNIFFINEEEIANSLKKYQKNISLIRIDRLYPNNIKILISGYPIIFSVNMPSIANKYWGMTENGILIPREEKTTALYPVIYIDESLNEDLSLDYKEIMKASEAQIMKKTLELFTNTWGHLPIESVIYLRQENEIHIVLKNKTRIFLTLQDFTKKTWEKWTYNYLRLQLISLKTFIENKNADIEKWIYYYIDARIPWKIFSCQDKTICKKNMESVYPWIIASYE